MSSIDEIFWGEISPCEHLVQVYEDDQVFLDSLEAFVTGGLHAGEAVVIIATAAHREALEDRLRANGVDIEAASSRDELMVLDAEETLARFMINNWPDEERFRQVVLALLERSRRTGRRVRAFGEMVAVLWARGQNGATVRLEHLWCALCREEAFSLFCAYPRIGFTQDMAVSMEEICAVHSRVVHGVSPSAAEQA